MNKLHKREKGFTLIELLVVISIIGVLAGLSLASIGPIMATFKKFQSKMKLVDLNKIFMIYKQDYNAYPTTMSSKDKYEKSAGVRGLYPLYACGLLKANDLNNLLHPPGAALIDFSSDPDIDEFDKYHCGYAYNSTAIPDDPDNPPIMSEQGVSSGILNVNTKDKGIKPIRKNGVMVLFADGHVKDIHADRRGKLSTKEISADMWGKLVD